MEIRCNSIDLLDLTGCDVCTAYRVVCYWVTERVGGFVTYLLFRIRNWCHWPVVHWLVYHAGGKVACKMFPSNLSECFCGMILIVLRFPLQFQSHVCYLVCAVHKQMLDYWFVCIVHVPCALRLWIFWIVQCMLCYRYYILSHIFHWGYFGLVSQLNAGMLYLSLIGLFLDWIQSNTASSTHITAW
jgi:hypothetical protein